MGRVGVKLPGMGQPRVLPGLLCLLVAAAACGSTAARSDGSGASRGDGSADRSTIPVHTDSDATTDAVGSDAPACSCTTDGSVLHMSWDCYCSAYGCSSVARASCGPLVTWAAACGLEVVSWMTIGGLNQRVFDQDGKLVGVRLASDVAEYGCSGPDAGTAAVVQAGQFPAASCTPVTCDCAVDGTASCPKPDAAAAP